jgi:uncharacterized membrane protein
MPAFAGIMNLILKNLGGYSADFRTIPGTWLWLYNDLYISTKVIQKFEQTFRIRFRHGNALL